MIINLICSKKGFQGKILGLQLTDIIQMNCLSRLTTALEITRDGERGVIYLNEGEIIHAECGDREGAEAFYKILSWQEGEFVSKIGIAPKSQTINQSWEHLLVEAMRRNDERE
jgi:two-component system chemotaxis response regulator CheB